MTDLNLTNFRAVDLSGRVFNHLTVIERIGKNHYGSPLWLVECECGARLEVSSNYLVHNKMKTCGCQIGRTPKLHLTRGEGHPNSKLNLEKVQIIRTSGREAADLADEFGVSIAAIEQCRKRMTWRHVK